jgi:hypothetical protein
MHWNRRRQRSAENWNCERRHFVKLLYMRRFHDWSWMQEQVARSIDLWNRIPARSAQDGPLYSSKEQEKRERAYDEALAAVEREARRGARSRTQRLGMQDRIIASFGRFAAVALDLEEEAVELLTGGFLPAGAQFAQGARRFDGELSTGDIIQACRNAWTACGLQPLLGEPMRLTPSIVGYSLLYPYSDNYLDSGDVDREAKLRFSGRFLERLRGETLPALNRRECAIWDLVSMIESQYPRASYPQVFDCLIAIHRAQEESIAQVRSNGHCDDAEVLRISCAKGGSSVLADACLCRGWVDQEESEFAFDWGVLLQLGDDLQDVREDVRRGSRTLLSRAAASGRPLDELTARLLNMSAEVSNRMDRMPNGGRALKGLLRMSWRSLIVMAVAETHELFSPEFVAEMERRSPFRFGFLRARQKRLAGRRGLYAHLFDAFLEPREIGQDDTVCNLSGVVSVNI